MQLAIVLGICVLIAFVNIKIMQHTYKYRHTVFGYYSFYVFIALIVSNLYCLNINAQVTTETYSDNSSFKSDKQEADPEDSYHLKSGDCESTLIIADTYNNGANEYFEVTDWISSTATINDGANVTFDAGNYILLEGVFLADKGAVFLAKIDGCDKAPDDFDGKKTDVPDAMITLENYPNPFTEQTTIEFTLSADVPVTLLVFDSMGQRIATLLDAMPTKIGTHQVTFDAADYSSGVYYYTIQAGEVSGTQKMTLIK